MEEILVSVIIPAYNAESTLRRALDSVLSQTYKNIEIIVVDDGSTDNTHEIIDAYDRQINSFTQLNNGASSARNQGVRLAKGGIIAFLDSDDKWHPNKLKTQVEVLNKFPEIGFCSTKLKFVSESEAINFSKIDITGPSNIRIELDFKKIFSNPYFGTPSVVITKKHFLSCGGFDESFKTAEDVDLWLRASYKKGVAIVQEPLTYVIGKADSLTQLSNFQTFKDNLKVIDKFCEKNPDFLMGNDKLITSVQAQVYTEWGSAVLTNGNHKFAAQLLLQGLKLRLKWRTVYLLLKSYLIGLKL
jgi:glycosyltransferase involved in cell wall biosynthesis